MSFFPRSSDGGEGKIVHFLRDGCSSRLSLTGPLGVVVGGGNHSRIVGVLPCP